MASPTPIPAARPVVPIFTTNDIKQLNDSRSHSFPAWFWQDDDGRCWRLYEGSSGPLLSEEIEKSYQKNPSGSFKFSLMNQSYVIDFATNTQTNKSTCKLREVERRMVHYVWFWEDNDGQWKQYDSSDGGVTSAQISASFHANRTGKFRFARAGVCYVMNFKSMRQKNKTTGKSCKIKWHVSHPPSTATVADLQTAEQPYSNDWYWQDDNNAWQPFDRNTSDSIEAAFVANPTGSLAFRHGAHSYQIDLQTSTQTNHKTGKKRPIVQSPKGIAPSPLANSQAPKVSVQPSLNDWYWQDDNNAWQPFDRNTSDSIEAAFVANPTGSLAFRHGAHSYQIDLQTSTQTNHKTGKKRPIVQSPKGIAPSPVANSQAPKVSVQPSLNDWYWQDDNNAWQPFDRNTSDSIEAAFVANPTGSLAFRHGAHSYQIDLQTSTQTNHKTGKKRPIVQSPKGIAPSPVANSQAPKVSVQPSLNDWYWQDDNNAWQPFDRNTSDSIEAAFVANPTGSLAFQHGAHSYQIDLQTSTQTNHKTGKKRPIVQSPKGIAPSPLANSQAPKVSVQPSLNDWYWQDDNNAWQPFDRNTSDSIEAAFVANPTGSLAFQHGAHSYQIDLQTSTQTNHKTGKKRPIVQSPKGIAPSPLANSQAPKVSVQPSLNDWYWQDDNNAWQPFDRNTSDSIEAAFVANPTGSLAFRHGAHSYQIDLQTSTQTNHKTGKKRPIVQSPKGIAPPSVEPQRTPVYPRTWDMNGTLDKLDFAVVDVPPSGPTASEFKAVSTLFNKSMPGDTLKSVKRIQNKILWEQFSVAKKQLENRLGPGNGVRQLFHGTKKERIEGLCVQGVDPRLSGLSTGTKYGQGSYFARDAAYSKDYTDSKTLLIAQVLVGDSAIGDPNMVRPPPKDKSQPNGHMYDSCVNDLTNPTIFVVFERAHSYPEYVIQY